MKNILVLLAMIAAFAGQGQTNIYHPFPDSNAQWNIHMLANGFPGPADEEFYSLVISGDTIINNVTYHKLTTPFVQSGGKSSSTTTQTIYRGAIRQDIANRTVYIVPPLEIVEQLLYDFNLQVGDTVRGYLESWVNPNEVVLSVDSVLVGSNYHKRWMINAGYNIYLIEGVGSTYGLIEFSPGYVVDVADFDITCFRQNGETRYPDPTSACELITGIDPVTPASDLIRIMPNPCQGSFTIDFGTVITKAVIGMTDMSGRVVLEEPVYHQQLISVSNLQSGTYILKVINDSGQLVIRKIICYPVTGLNQ